jgi:Skp family chaperone for outer membrane proteins
MLYRHRQSLAVIALVAVATSLLTAVGLHGQSESGPLRIAVVDVQKVFQNLEEKGAVEADITQQTEELQKKEQQKKQEINSLRSDLEILSPESDAYQETKQELERKAIEFQAWKKFKKRQLEAEKSVRIESLYRNVVDACREISRDKGYDLILQKDKLPSLRGQNQQELTALILQRKVLHADKRLDVTDQVLQICNNRYNNRNSGNGANNGSGGSDESG